VNQKELWQKIVALKIRSSSLPLKMDLPQILILQIEYLL
jgi:hypothetical protein